MVSDAKIGNINEFLIRIVLLCSISEPGRHESVDVAQVIGHSMLHRITVYSRVPARLPLIPVILTHALLDDAANFAERLPALDSISNVSQMLAVPEREPLLRQRAALSSDILCVLVLN